LTTVAETALTYSETQAKQSVQNFSIEDKIHLVKQGISTLTEKLNKIEIEGSVQEDISKLSLGDQLKFIKNKMETLRSNIANTSIGECSLGDISLEEDPLEYLIQRKFFVFCTLYIILFMF
jgi:hypothetical protein